MKLQPNCSEVCWRLEVMPAFNIKEQIIESLENNPCDDDDYSCYSQGDDIGLVFNDMLSTLKDFKNKNLDYNKIELDFTDGGEGGGDYGAVEDCFDYAMRVASGEMKKNEALRLLQCEDADGEYYA